ncbi:MAG: ECF transporter S component [Clostridia bacterium]|nr:ECF transporter S component [Clostridia bacterium]
MRSDQIQKTVYAALLGAMVFVATWVSFPTPFGGNVNMGDCALLLAVFFPLEPWSIVACAVGASLTDLLGGYAVYAPATLVIKALMVAVGVCIKRVTSKLPSFVRALLCGVGAEVCMVVGYYVYEAFALYGAVAALANVPFNLLQGGVACAVACALLLVISQMPLPRVLKEGHALFLHRFTKKQ